MGSHVSHLLEAQLKGWHRAEASFSLRHIITRTVAHLLLPTCLLELLVIWLLVPVWGILVFPPFLVLPAVNLLLLRASGGMNRVWGNCEVSFQREHLMVRLPGRDLFSMKPSVVRVLSGGRLEVKGRNGTVSIEAELAEVAGRSGFSKADFSV